MLSSFITIALPFIIVELLFAGTNIIFAKNLDCNEAVLTCVHVNIRPNLTYNITFFHVKIVILQPQRSQYNTQVC